METKRQLGWQYCSMLYASESEALERERKDRIYELSQVILSYPDKKVLSDSGNIAWEYWDKVSGIVGKIRELEEALRNAYLEEGA